MNNIDLNRKPLLLELNKKVGFFHPYYKLEMGSRIAVGQKYLTNIKFELL